MEQNLLSFLKSSLNDDISIFSTCDITVPRRFDQLLVSELVEDILNQSGYRRVFQSIKLWNMRGLDDCDIACVIHTIQQLLINPLVTPQHLEEKGILTGLLASIVGDFEPFRHHFCDEFRHHEAVNCCVGMLLDIHNTMFESHESWAFHQIIEILQARGNTVQLKPYDKNGFDIICKDSVTLRASYVYRTSQISTHQSIDANYLFCYVDDSVCLLPSGTRLNQETPQVITLEHFEKYHANSK